MNSSHPQNTDNKALKVLILGGSRGTGKETIKHALKQGYKVTSMTRSLTKAVKFEEGEVEWIEGSVTDPEVLSKAVKGQDCIISTIGPDGLGKTTLYSDSAPLIVKAMKEHKVKRLLLVTADVKSPSHNWIAKHLVFRFLLNKVIEDQERMEKYFEELPDKDIEWTIVRPFHLTNGPFTGNYRFGPSDLMPYYKTQVTRSDLGDFLVKEMVAKQWVRNFVSVGN